MYAHPKQSSYHKTGRVCTNAMTVCSDLAIFRHYRKLYQPSVAILTSKRTRYALPVNGTVNSSCLCVT